MELTNCRKYSSSKVFRTLDRAQHECLRDDKCGSIFGYNGNVFEHTEFALCPVGIDYYRVNAPHDWNVYHPILPSALYLKPGKGLYYISTC